MRYETDLEIANFSDRALGLVGMNFQEQIEAIEKRANSQSGLGYKIWRGNNSIELKSRLSWLSGCDSQAHGREATRAAIQELRIWCLNTLEFDPLVKPFGLPSPVQGKWSFPEQKER